MIIFIYGEEQFLSLEYLRALKQKYIDANLGDTNLVQIEAKEFNPKSFAKQIVILPFLAKKRLIIVKNLLVDGRKVDQEKVFEILKKGVPDTTVVVFYEAGMPDKRTKLFKFLSKHKVSKEFKRMTPVQLKNWVRKQLDEKVKNKKYLRSGFVQNLLEQSSNDLFKLNNQIEKISLYLNSGQKLEKDDLVSLDSVDVKSDVFGLIDKIAKRDTQGALAELHMLLKNGENELYILSMIVYQFRNMLVVKDYIEIEKIEGRINAYQVSKKIKMHPFVLQKITAIIGNFSFEELKEVYSNLFIMDIQIKNGDIEPVMALDEFIVKTTTTDFIH